MQNMDRKKRLQELRNHSIEAAQKTGAAHVDKGNAVPGSEGIAKVNLSIRLSWERQAYLEARLKKEILRLTQKRIRAELNHDWKKKEWVEKIIKDKTARIESMINNEKRRFIEKDTKAGTGEHTE